MSSVSPDQAIARLASSQHGVFTWDQALACGLSPEMVRRRTAAGRWDRLSKGIYRLGGAPATWRQGLLATCFAAGSDAVASHLAAAALHRLPAGRARLEITVPRVDAFDARTSSPTRPPGSPPSTWRRLTGSPRHPAP